MIQITWDPIKNKTDLELNTHNTDPNHPSAQPAQQH